MKQVFLSQGKAIVKDVPQPLLDANMVLVEVMYSCISSGTERATRSAASDMAMKSGTAPIRTGILTIGSDHRAPRFSALITIVPQKKPMTLR